MDQYEVAVLYHPGLEIDLEKGSGKVEKIFADNKGKVVNADNWGKRKLAYPIRKSSRGVFVFLKYLGFEDLVAEIERNLRLLDSVVRYQTVVMKPGGVVTAAV